MMLSNIAIDKEAKVQKNTYCVDTWATKKA
jgi:hypothetical protein